MPAGLITRPTRVRFPSPPPRPDSSAGERRPDATEAGGSTPPRGTPSRLRLWVGPGPFKPVKRVRAPQARPISRRSTVGQRIVTPPMLVRVQPGELWRGRRLRKRRWKRRARREVGRGFESLPLRQRAAAHLVGETCLMSRPRRVRSPGGARRSCPCSSVGERPAHTRKAPGSSPGAGTRGGCSAAVGAPGCGPGTRGFESRRSPQGSVGQVVSPAACKAVAQAWRFDSSRSHFCPRGATEARGPPKAEAAGSSPAGDAHGRLPEWLGSGLQHRLPGFESPAGLDAIRCGENDAGGSAPTRPS